MTFEKRLENAKIWADTLRKVRGSVESTYTDGEIVVTSTPEKMIVTVNGIEQ